MQMFKNEGTFTPDSLIVSPDFPILKEGIGLKSGQGVLKRGTVICKGTDGKGYIAGKTVSVTTGEGDAATTSDMEMKAFGILTDNMDTGDENATDDVPAVVYTTGMFNRGALIVADGAEVATFEDALKGIGIHLRDVQNY